MKYFFTSCFLLFFFLCYSAQETSLKERFHTAESGNYIVLAQDKTLTFLHIYDTFDHHLVLEEITVPSAKIPKKNFSWGSWLEQGAPGNTSWTMSEIDLQTGQILQAYSFTRRGWLDPSYANTFISTLLNLRFKEIPFEERKKIGPQPLYGKEDLRPLWNPRMIIEGKIIPNLPFSAWRARWPNDGTELARRKIEIYLPENPSNSELSFLNYFPYWIDIEGKLGGAQVRIVDSGLSATSPQPPIYRITPPN